jgi:hypothetical protein
VSIRSRLQLFRVDHPFECHGHKLSPSRLHVPFGKLLVAEVLQHAPSVHAEEVSHVLGIHTEEKALVLQDRLFVEVLCAIEDFSIYEVLANVRERQATARRRLGQKIEGRPDAGLGQVLGNPLPYEEGFRVGRVASMFSGRSTSQTGTLARAGSR